MYKQDGDLPSVQSDDDVEDGTSAPIDTDAADAGQTASPSDLQPRQEDMELAADIVIAADKAEAEQRDTTREATTSGNTSREQDAVPSTLQGAAALGSEPQQDMDTSSKPDIITSDVTDEGRRTETTDDGHQAEEPRAASDTRESEPAPSSTQPQQHRRRVVPRPTVPGAVRIIGIDGTDDDDDDDDTMNMSRDESLVPAQVVDTERESQMLRDYERLRQMEANATFAHVIEEEAENTTEGNRCLPNCPVCDTRRRRLLVVSLVLLLLVALIFGLVFGVALPNRAQSETSAASQPSPSPTQPPSGMPSWSPTITPRPTESPTNSPVPTSTSHPTTEPTFEDEIVASRVFNQRFQITNNREFNEAESAAFCGTMENYTDDFGGRDDEKVTVICQVISQNVQDVPESRRGLISNVLNKSLRNQRGRRLQVTFNQVEYEMTYTSKHANVTFYPTLFQNFVNSDLDQVTADLQGVELGVENTFLAFSMAQEAAQPSSSPASIPAEPTLSNAAEASASFNQRFQIRNNREFDEFEMTAFCSVMESYTERFGGISDETTSTTCQFLSQSLQIIGGRQRGLKEAPSVRRLQVVFNEVEYHVTYRSSSIDVSEYPVLFQKYVNGNLDQVAADLQNADMAVENAFLAFDNLATLAPTTAPTITPQPTMVPTNPSRRVSASLQRSTRAVGNPARAEIPPLVDAATLLRSTSNAPSAADVAVRVTLALAVLLSSFFLYCRYRKSANAGA